MTSTLVFSTQSDSGITLDAITEWEVVPPMRDEHEPHCFVCGRHTDHFGEHDDMVALNLAWYDKDGDVMPTELFRTPLGRRMREVLSSAWDEMFTALYGDPQRRQVSLIKPVGQVMTFLGSIDTAG